MKSHNRFLPALIAIHFSISGIFAAEETQPAPAALVRGIKVLPDKAADCSSLKSIVNTVTRGCTTNDQKAVAIYNFMRLTHYHRAYPSEPGGIPVLKEINCYGWSLCGGLHAEQSALWRELGWNWRFVGWPGHTTVEAFYDGRWHYLDVFLKLYAWMPDPNNPTGRTIAGEDDLASNPEELLTNAFVLDSDRKVMYAKGNEFSWIGGKANWQAPAFLVCGDDLPGIIDALRHKNRVGPEPGWGGMQHATGNYSADVNLAPGFSLTSTWDKDEGAWYWAGSQIAPCHTCGDKEIRNSPEKGPIVEPYLGPDWKCESYANGELTFRPDFSSPHALQSFVATENATVRDAAIVATKAGMPATVTVLLKSPYILIDAKGSADGADRCEVSKDNGKSWSKVDLKGFGKAVAGQVQALVRLTFADRLKSLSLSATVQNNPFALPYLSPGKNTVNVSVTDPAALGDNKLVVTYAYRTGARRKSYEELLLEGKEIARGHDATWDQSPTVVQKVFGAADLPASFEIDVPTPKGMHPVYPRMVFVRRQVIGPNQLPLPLPANSSPPKRSPGDELATLPNPFLIGTQPPTAKVARPAKVVTVELAPGHFVTRSGQVPSSHVLKWPKIKDEQVEAIAYLIGGELKGLPAPKELVSARLVFTAEQAHDKAPTKVGLAALKKPFVTGQPYDFDQLGDVFSTVIVPKVSEETPVWSPPREFKIDVTRYMRSLIVNGNAGFHGFALRVVPDRAVDDGWTVRVNLPPQPRIVLELETE